AQPAPEPPVAEHRSQRVAPLSQRPCDVKRLVPETVSIARPPRGEDVVAHAGTVQLQLVDTVGGDVEPGGGDLTTELELAPQQRPRLWQRGVFVPVRADELRRPVASVQQPRLHPVPVAPGRRRAASCAPDPYPAALALTSAQ